MKAIYARQSLDKKDSVSIETQTETCKRCINETDDFKVYFDKGFSGKNTQRPALEELLNDIKADKIEKIVVYRLDRFSRNITDFYKMYEIMKEHKCEFVSASESFDTSTAMGRAMMGILAIFAQMERESIQQRVKDNYYFRTADTGSWAGGPSPFGFRNGRTAERRPTLVQDEHEMAIVQEIFRLYHDSPLISLGKIVNYLNEHEMFSRRENGSWDSSAVSKMLQNTVYVKADDILYQYLKLRQIKFLNPENEWTGQTACHVVGKRPGNANVRKYASLKEQSVYLTNFPGVIDSSTYVDVMNRLSLNEQINNKTRIGVLEELGGVLKCECGYAIKSYSRSTTGRPYLDCYANRTLHVCKHKYNHFNFYELKQQVADEIQVYFLNQFASRRKTVETRQKKLDEIATLEERLNALLDLATSDLLEQATRSKIEEVQRKINQLQLDIIMMNDKLQLTEDGTPYIPSELFYEDFTVEQRKAAVNQLIEKIILHEEDSSIEIFWRVPDFNGELDSMFHGSGQQIDFE